MCRIMCGSEREKKRYAWYELEFMEELRTWAKAQSQINRKMERREVVEDDVGEIESSCTLGSIDILTA